jgi:hypothetical protein
LLKEVPLLNASTAGAAALLAASALWSVQGASAQSPMADTLPLERTVTGRTLSSRADPALQLQVAEPFRYIGGQRFVLRGVADAEQHFFADVDARNTVRGIYWIQFERFLPGRGTEYSYAQDAPISVGHLELRASVRTFTDQPAPDSDRRRAYEFLAHAGFVVPTPAIRVRLVHVPEADRRQEVMIIYLEPAETGAEPTAEAAAALIQRATQALLLLP